METLKAIADHAGDICTIATCAALLIKPIRERLLGTEAIREGQRCLLRSEIVRIYYRHVNDKQLHEYEYKNLTQCYKAYKALGGNSFIDHIYVKSSIAKEYLSLQKIELLVRIHIMVQMVYRTM